MGLGTYSRSWNKNKIDTYQGICEMRVIYIKDYLYNVVIQTIHSKKTTILYVKLILFFNLIIYYAKVFNSNQLVHTT